MMGDTRTLPELQAESPRIAILPIGSFEQHGAHLPYTTDTLIAQILAQGLARRLPALLLSPLTLSCSHEHAGFPYSVSISAQTLAATVRDVFGSLRRSGVELLIVMNAHGGNYVLGNVAQELNQDAPGVVILPQRQHWQAALDASGLDVSISADMHGGAIETSLLMHAMPDVVKVEHRRDHDATARPLLTTLGMRHYTPHGIIGRPSQATPEAGERLLNTLIEAMHQEITGLLALLDPARGKGR